MSMYSQLLGSALEHAGTSDVVLTASETMAELLRSRRRIAQSASGRAGSQGISNAIADQLAYDVALLSFAHSAGIAWDISTFAQPSEARMRLERELLARGIDLDARADETLDDGQKRVG